MKIKVLFFAFFLIISAKAQINFETPIVLEQGFFSSFGTAIADMNNDGRQDVIKVSYRDNIGSRGKVSISSQNSDGSFDFHYIDTVKFDPFLPGAWSMCVAEINNDDINDFFVGVKGYQVLFKSTGVWEYEAFVFEDSFFIQTTNFVDIDNDGDLDLFACNDDSLNITYENDGNGNFSKNQNMIPAMNPYSGSYGSVWSDYDDDGDLDLYISKCRAGVTDPLDPRRVNLLYRNDGGTYTEVSATANLNDGEQSWASDFGDIDNDGDLDVLTINHKGFNKLYENNGDGTFTNISSLSNIGQYDTINYWQCLFRDLDNDGFLDIILAHEKDKEIFYHNNGNKTFTPIINSFSTPLMYSCSLGDLNNDGFIDLYGIGNPIPNPIDDQIILNSGNTNNYLSLLLEGTASGKNAIGSKIKLYGNWGVQVREIRSGESYGIHNSFAKNFGLGSMTTFDSLIIEWNSGNKCKIDSLDLNQKYRITESCKVDVINRIDEESEANITVFPTVLKKGDIIQINSVRKGEYALFDMQGKRLDYSLNSSKKHLLSTGSLFPGTYIIQFFNSHSQKCYKVIIL